MLFFIAVFPAYVNVCDLKETILSAVYSDLFHWWFWRINGDNLNYWLSVIQERSGLAINNLSW